MPSIIKRERERNINSNDFLQENKPDFDANDFAKEKIILLNDKIAESENAGEEQIASDGGARQNYEIAGEADHDLRDAMRDVADFAVTLSDEIEGIEEKFRMPRSGGKRARIARARVFADQAEPIKDKFTKRGLEADFVENLRAKADTLEAALASAVSETAQRVSAGSANLLAHKEASKTVALLNPIVRKRYRDDPKKLAAWTFASHVRRADEPKPPPAK